MSNDGNRVQDLPESILSETEVLLPTANVVDGHVVASNAVSSVLVTFDHTSRLFEVVNDVITLNRVPIVEL